MSDINGWYTYDPAGQGIAFAGNGQAILFGNGYAGQQVWVVLAHAEDSNVWNASIPGVGDIGYVVISENSDGTLTLQDNMSHIALGDSGFSPLPPPKFSGNLTEMDLE